MTSCKLSTLCHDYDKGELSARESSLFERHLPECPDCQRQLEREKHLASLLTGIQTPALAEEKARETLQLVFAEMDRAPIPGRNWREYLDSALDHWRILVPAASTIILLLVFVGYQANYFSANQQVPTLFSLSHLRQIEPEIQLEDPYLSFVNANWRERSEANEVLAQLNKDSSGMTENDEAMVQSIDYSPRESQVGPATFLFLEPTENAGFNQQNIENGSSS